VKAGRSVYFATLADIVASLAKAEREGSLRERMRFLAGRAARRRRNRLPAGRPGGGNLFFQLVNARYEKGAMILTSNRGFAEWGEVFGDPSSPPRCSTDCCTMPSSSRSKARATGCVSTPISCRRIRSGRNPPPRRTPNQVNCNAP
jgi:hypothetical protein